MMNGAPLLVVGRETAAKAMSKVDSCASCAQYADFEFSYVIALARDAELEKTEYFLAVPCFCPRCGSKIQETTFVQIYNS